MKVVNKLGENDLKDEFTLMSGISHQNIVKYYEHFDHEVDGRDSTCVITEYCEVKSQICSIIYNLISDSLFCWIFVFQREVILEE